MLHETDAKNILTERVKNGATLLVASQGDLPTIKQLQAKCLEANIPTMLGPCASSG